MQRTFFSLALLLVLTATAWSQIPRAHSRGFIPPLFTLPDETEELRFTSAAQPRFMLPDYPEEQLNSGAEGVVELMLYVTSEGEVVYAEVTVSSGVDEFDDAALVSAMKAQFPEGYATVKGLPRDFRLAVPFYFMLSADPENYWQTRLELARVQQEYEQVMARFEDYLMARTTATDSKIREIQRQMEEKVAAAKSIHRLLAEKKETAILRLRQEIDDSREEHPPVADANDTAWRRGMQDYSRATVLVVTPGNSVTSEQSLGTEGMERLTQELEMKKSYL